MVSYLLPVKRNESLEVVCEHIYKSVCIQVCYE